MRGRQRPARQHARNMALVVGACMNIARRRDRALHFSCDRLDRFVRVTLSDQGSRGLTGIDRRSADTTQREAYIREFAPFIQRDDCRHARERKIAPGRKLRVDTTVVETNIHYPTDSSLLGDGVRALTRVMKKVGEISGPVGTLLRNRTRSIKLKVLAIARASRNKTESGKEKLNRLMVHCWKASSES